MINLGFWDYTYLLLYFWLLWNIPILIMIYYTIAIFEMIQFTQSHLSDN